MSWLCVLVAYRRLAVERVALHVGVVICSCEGRSFNAVLNPLVRRSIAALSWSGWNRVVCTLMCLGTEVRGVAHVITRCRVRVEMDSVGK